MKIIIIGAGPGGYETALLAAKRGVEVVLIESGHVGGTCLNEGCIPSKALLNSGKLYEHAKESEVFGVTAENVKIEVTKIEEKTLNKKQKEAIKDKDIAVVISATIFADDTKISDFGGGKIKVEIPFTPVENTKGTEYKVVYIADDGKVTVVPSKYVNGKMVVELEHFSEYAIVKDKKAENKVENTVENKVENTTSNEGGTGANTSAPATSNEKDNTPKTGAVSVLAVVIVLAIVGYVSFRREER